MQKQRNRGQDGAGFLALHPGAPAGQPYYLAVKVPEADPFDTLLQKVHRALSENAPPLQGTCFAGHVRYGTYGGYSLEACQPIVLPALQRAQTIFFAGNFNLTNIQEVWSFLRRHRISPPHTSDTFLLATHFAFWIQQGASVADALKECSVLWDGGWAFIGGTGTGTCFVYRDPWGIRPAYFTVNERFIACASERGALSTAFSVSLSEIEEVPPGKALIVDEDGTPALVRIRQSASRVYACSFERIYFSRPSDPAIYEERYRLGAELAGRVLPLVRNTPVEKIAFSYVPNTAEPAFLGLTDRISELLGQPVRRVKLLVKDTRLRTFISREEHRSILVRHVYDLTWFAPGTFHTLVVIDDSIVRGTTLRESILTTLAHLAPRRIIFVSSAPQIRYPDFYGIDMSRLDELIAFQAVVSLLTRSGRKTELFERVIEECQQVVQAREPHMNPVQQLYALFREEEISREIARLVRPRAFAPELIIVYQSVAGLHRAIPHHRGDWYFTGEYPTPGGRRMVAQAFLDYVEVRHRRPYELVL